MKCVFLLWVLSTLRMSVLHHGCNGGNPYAAARCSSILIYYKPQSLSSEKKANAPERQWNTSSDKSLSEDFSIYKSMSVPPLWSKGRIATLICGIQWSSKALHIHENYASSCLSWLSPSLMTVLQPILQQGWLRRGAFEVALAAVAGA